MRTKNSLKNMYIGIFTQVVITLLGFISRKVLFDSLGEAYLGVNGVLTNVLSMLSLVEGGIGTSIVYNLYKPLAEDDKEKTISLIQLYKKLYSILCILVFSLSLAVYPFLGVLMKDNESISNLTLVYFIFVARNMISYLNAHKWSLINADQKGYVLSKINLIFNIVTTISKIIVLKLTKDYVFFLVIDLIIFVIQNIYNGSIVNKRYSYIKTKEKYKVDKEIKENLITNVKALFLHNIGRFCVFGTDNILISSFIGLGTAGRYSNYTMVIGQLSALVNPILNSISASVGNLIATENEEKTYEIFKVTYFINFWIFSWCSIFLYNLLEPFIDLWMGKGLLLDKFTFIVVLINFYISGLRTSIGIFKEKAGIFKEDKYVPLIEALVNLVSSIILVRYFGLVGIFIGTTISTICFPLWNQPRLVYKKLFKRPLYEYFKSYTIYALVTLIGAFITTFTCNLLVSGKGFIYLIFKGIICLIVPNIVICLAFYKKYEFKYIMMLINNILNTNIKKLTSKYEVIKNER